MLDHFYSKQEALKISYAMNTPYDKRSDKWKNILIDTFAIELEVFQDQCCQISKQ